MMEQTLIQTGDGKADTTQSTTSSSIPSIQNVPVAEAQQRSSILAQIVEKVSQAMDVVYKKTPDSVTSSCVEEDNSSLFHQFVHEPCSTCAPLQRFTQSPPRRSLDPNAHQSKPVPPDQNHKFNFVESRATNVFSDSISVTTPQVILERRKKRNEEARRDMPIKSFTVKTEEVYDLERSISELTMKSSYGGATTQMVESRRMAYYAVGIHHKHSGRGGNRRCYFTGKLILGGAPFYAGSVQQGLRSLVVFCLPSAIGLPNISDEQLLPHRHQRSDLSRKNSLRSLRSSRSGRSGKSFKSKESTVSSKGALPLPRHLMVDKISRAPTKTSQSLVSSFSRVTSISTTDTSFLEEELDKNWDIDRDYLLKLLPDPSQSLLDEMASRYPDQYETLPLEVRSPKCWKLYIKFCFFSGLPIAEGELHYQVVDDVASELYGEEINLSHEVMEAVNGEASADILRLPNMKTFKYLRKHYAQQSSKLPDSVFQRTSWEMVLPEV